MNTSKTLSKLALPLLFLFLIVSVAQGLTLNSVGPAWSSIIGTSGAPDCLTTPTVGPEVQVRFGDDDFAAPCPGNPNVQSGLGFEGGSLSIFDSAEPFVLGELTHYNNPVFANSLLLSASLNLTVDFGDPVYSSVFSTTVSLDETANNLNTCPYGDTQPCADRISVQRQSFLFTVGVTNYQFEIIGMIPGTLGSCAYDESLISTNFVSDENASNSACLFGTLTTLDDSEIIISKQADVIEAEAGDLITYQIDYNCFSTTSSCNGVVITDFLPDEVVYVGSTGSTHTTQSTGTYSEDNHSVRFTFISPMAAGSTGYVRIRARVRADGVVGNGQLIENTAVSTMTNGASNTATNIIPAVAYSNWEANKTGPATAYIDTDAPVTDMTYTVGICPAGSTVNLLNAVMIDTLPDGSVFVNATGSPTYDAGPPQTLTWDMGDLNAANGCANEQVTVRFPSPPFNSGDLVTNTVDASGDPVGEPPWVDSDSVDNILTVIVPDPRATLDKVSDRSSYIVGAIAQFRLNPANTGNVPLQNFTVTDTLPPQLEVTRISVGSYNNYSGPVNIRYQSSNNPGVWVDWPGGPFSDNNQILDVSSLGLPGGAYITQLQWQYGTVLPGFTTSAGARIYARILNPDNNGDPVADGDTINNTAELTWDYPPGNGGSGISGTEPGSASITVTVMPSPLFNKNSGGGISAAWRFLIGQQVGYYTLNPNNNSGVALDDFIITDTPPAQFDVTGITLGQYSNFGGGQVTIRYQSSSTGSTWNVWPGRPFTPSNQTLNVSSLGLGSAYITAVQWDFGTVPIDFIPSTAPRVLGRIINPDNNGDPVNDGDNITNEASLSWTFEDLPDELTSNRTDPVRQPIAQPAPQKTEVTAGPYIPSSIVTYSLRIMAASNSPSVLINPIVADLLPTGMSYVPGSWTFDPGSTGAPAPQFEQIPNYNSTGRTLLRWSFTGASAFNFSQNQAAYIRFNLVIDPGVNIGTLTNEYHLMSNDVPIIPTTSDVNDLDGDGQTDDGLSGSSDTIIVDELVGLDSVKGVRGELDTDFSVYPDTGRTIPGGEVTYRLSVINEGNVPIQNVKVIDILPFVGDTGVQDLRQRDSVWRPVLTGLVASPPGVTVYYSTSGNPCRPDIVSSGPAGCTPPNWSTLPPADVTSVQSLRFDFAGILDPGETFSFTWTMQAPLNAPEGEIAWNSFAFTSTNAQSGYPLRPAEPNKVGIEIEIPEVSPLIELIKYTNGDDANLPTGPVIALGDPVTWTYLITNGGNTRLANVTLTDDRLGPITCDEGPIPTLEIGDDFLCTFTGTATISGQYVNIGTVVATPVDEFDVPLTDPDTGDPLPPVTDDDPSHYLGYTPALARLGDFVWIDLDGDGIQDGGEPGLPGVTVNLYDSEGTLIDTTSTNGTGFYYFVDLAPDEYSLGFVLPGVYSFTLANEGGDDDLDSDADPITGLTPLTTLDPGENDPSWDAGVIARASIGDYVWVDLNNNGIQDVGEARVSGVTVRLLDSGGTVINTTITDISGTYRFTDLEPGTYAVEFVLPSGYTFSPQDAGVDDARDSDANPTTGRTINTLLSPDENDPTWDAGLVPLASIGDRVWSDLDSDGIQDPGEPGIANVTVNLRDSVGTIIDTTTTAANGIYRFNDLIPGDYSLQFVAPAAGYIPSPANVGLIEAVDSDADIVTGETALTSLLPDEDDLTWDAGFIPLASIGDRVWLDIDNDGVQDGGESGVPGVTVNLLDDGGNVIDTDITDASGNYLFENLVPGDYAIEVILPADHVFSPRDATGNTADSDVDRATGRTIVTTLSPDEDDLTWDAGIVPDASIGNYIWYDDNNDGVQDGGEPVGAGVTVNLLNSGGTVIDTTVTNGSGFYLFDNLTPATYALEFVPPAGYVPARRDVGDDALDSDPNRFTGRTINTTLAPDEDDMTWDMGLVLAASIGDFVWRDNDGDSVQDGGEPGVQNVTVRLLDSTNTVIATTTTDASGFYSFTNLPPDDYRIEVVLPAGFVFALPNVGGDPALDSDVDITTGRSILTTLDPGENDDTWDAGLIPVASIGDFVWRDNDNDGVQDGGTEVGIQNITVNLLDSGGTIIDTTTTDANGEYLFDNLRPGIYAIEFVLPATGYIRSPQDAGGNDANDSDADITTGRTINVTLAPNQQDLTWDAGLTPLGSIGNRVWRDNNMNGVQNNGEPNMANITVRLLDSTGLIVLDTTTTNASGIYLFDELPAGSYIVEFVLPASTIFSPQDAGGNDATDSDANTTTGRTAIINLPWGVDDDTWDAGMIPLASIGNYVWYDANDDGLQTGESGVTGVTVNLYTSGGTFVSTTTTNTSGIYGFADLVPGNYFVEFVLPADHVFSRRDVGGNNNIDSDPDRATGRTIVTNLTPGENDISWDAGIMLVASLGDYVWYDTNDNGIQDVGEPGVENVTVTLYDTTNTVIDGTTTDADGLYLFEDLVPGTYYVIFTPPAGHVFSRQNIGSDLADSDPDRTTGRTANIVLSPGENDLSNDAGVMEVASLGNYVWNDVNDDGLQTGESGVAGVVVNLYTGTGTFVATDTTDGSGLYLFENLVPGTYYVDFILPSGYVFSRQNIGADISLDSDPDRTSGETIVTTLTPGEDDISWDAGIMQVASIGNFVWDDLNADGVQDGGEPGLPGVTVTLYDSDDNLIGTDITDGSGLYLFENLVPGDYYVVFTPPAGYIFSPQDDAGATEATDSDADPATGAAIETNLAPGENDMDWDAGMYRLASLGNFVWNDLNADGVQDGGELGVENITVMLYDSGDYLIGTDTTDANGAYLFADLEPGEYYVVFTLPLNSYFSPQDATTDAIDSDADTTTGRAINTTLTSGEYDDTWDAGIYQLASLGNFVWDDLNADGVQDGGEPGIPTVTVTLYDNLNNIVDTTTTDGDGEYLFDNLVPGTYYVIFTPPADYNFSPQDAAGDSADSDANPANGRTINTALTSGEYDDTWDAGLYQFASLGNYVWYDTNADGLQDGTESGVPGVTVTLYDSLNNVIDTDTTDGSGFYLFENLVPGTYYVIFTPLPGYVFSPQDAAGDSVDSDANPANGRAINTALTSGEYDDTWDAGLYQYARLGNFVWNDLNADGVQGGGELGIPNVTVTLYDSGDNIVVTTTTDGDGLYLFDDLVPGTYYVIFTAPASFIYSPQDATGDAADSDANPANGRTINITLIANQSDDTWDAGMYQLASLGNFVWDDLNADGVQNLGEPGVENVTVTLYDSGDNIVDTDSTDGNGAYLFADLEPGEYYVVFTLPLNSYFSPQDAGGNDALDSDADTTTGRAINTMLTSGEYDDTWDAGIYQLASLGNFIWDDLNADGVQNLGEPGVENVTVTLYDNLNNIVDTTTADALGFYLFENLVPGIYYVDFTPPADYNFSPLDATTDTIDSDANPANGQTTPTDLISGENDDTWDAGLYRYASISNFVWQDTNADGIQDVGEPGIPGVTVTLYDSSDNVIDTTTTDGNGLYLFDDLVPGTYYVVFTLLPDFNFSPQDATGDAADSDANTTTGRAINTVLVSGENDDTWDAGMYQYASLGDYVWEDMNADGIQDLGEIGIPGVAVTLYDSGDNVIDTTTTDGDGLYLFDDLVPGTYYVVFTLLPDFNFSPQDATGDAADSDADTTTGRAINTTLVSNEDDPTWDAGMYQYASLGDFVWQDTNADGIQDVGEPGLPGVTVTLYDSGDNIIDSTTTDGSGAYLFDDLVPGDYYVVFTLLPDFNFSPQDATADDADSDANSANGRAINTTLVSNEDDPTWDAGMYQYASLGDFVWDDLNADGVQDGGEPPVENVTVTLYDSLNNIVDSTTTDADGLYLFDDLVPGTYYVMFTLPTDYNFSPLDATTDATDSDADTATGRTIDTTLISGEDDRTWDAGIYQYASLGDFVWDDLNADGVQDNGEPGVAGVTVTLYDGLNNVIDTDTTDTDGFYLFDDLVPGDYYVVFTLPTDYVFSPLDTLTATDAADSDADTTTGAAIQTTLISGEDDLTWDAGMYQYASLGNFVWDDLNADGGQNAGELGIPGVTVTLYDSGDNVIDTTTTDAGGLYLFENLVPGDYYVVFTLLPDYYFSPQDQRGDDALDSDADTATGQAATTTLISNEEDLTWDAGMYMFASLGDFMWYDDDDNGIQNTTEPLVTGITVTLFDGANNVIATTLTDASGFYLFEDLVPGDYSVGFDVPDRYMFAKANRGLDDTLDSDVNESGRTPATDLISGEFDPTWDAGIVLIPSGIPFALTPSPTPVPPVGDPSQPGLACQIVCVNWMLYHTNQTGDWEIFRLGDMEGSLDANLSQGEGSNDIAPSRSPNAEWIVFASDRDENWEIYLAPSNGDSSLIRRLTFNTVAIDTDPVWGPGNYVVFESTRSGNWDLFLMDMTSGAVRQITDSSASDINAYWSPDGSKLIFQSDRSGQWQIYELDLGTLNVKLLSDGQGIDLDPQYSNGGSQIAFRSYRDGSDSVLHLMNADGSGVRPFSDLTGDATDHSWSPDDSLIAYQSDLDDDLDIYVYEVGTGQTRKLTDNDIPDYAPTWQCSTTRVVFTSDIVGNPDIFDAEALPISAPAIEVDEEAIQLTFALTDDIYPEGAPLEENASREGQLPNAAPLGEQTTFLEPDFSLTEIDLTLDLSEVEWTPIDGCAALPPEQ